MDVSNLQWSSSADLGGTVTINGAGPYPYDTDDGQYDWLSGSGDRFAYLGTFSDVSDLQSRVHSVPKVWLDGNNAGTVFGGNPVAAGVARIPGPQFMGVPVLLIAGVVLLIWAFRTGRISLGPLG